MPKKIVVNRIFYIDVGQISPQDVPNFMQKVKESLTVADDKASVVEQYKSIGMWEDFFIPIRGGMVTKKKGIFRRIWEWLFGGPADEELVTTRIELHKVELP